MAIGEEGTDENGGRNYGNDDDEEAQDWDKGSLASAPPTLSSTPFARHHQQRHQLHGIDKGVGDRHQQEAATVVTTHGAKHRRIVRYNAAAVPSTSSALPRTPRGIKKIKSETNKTEDLDATDHIRRGLVATPLNSETCQPMSPGARFIRNIRLEDTNIIIGGGGGENEGGGGGGTTQMYRLMATRGTRNVGRFWVSLAFGC